jgi:hypothetical protein
LADCAVTHSWAWRFEKRDPAGMEVGESLPLKAAQAKRLAFDAQIATAREDGWR